MKEILNKLCMACGVSGNEYDVSEIAAEMLKDYTQNVIIDNNGNVYANFGKADTPKSILLDAHIDRIGLVVTYIDDNGFLKGGSCGGLDMRTLPGSSVTVYGKEPITGVICTLPPHLQKDDSQAIDKDEIWIDTGLPCEVVREKVSLGDCVMLNSFMRPLLNDRVACGALDNRIGCAVLIRCAELLKDKELPCRLTILLSVQEETTESGAKTGIDNFFSDEAVIVDVGFAHQNGVPNEKSGALGGGSIITLAPSLSKPVTEKLIEISKEMGLACDYEVCGGTTGTNADAIASARSGVACGVISIPERNMHTQVEVIDLKDAENIAQLLAKFILGNGSDIQNWNLTEYVFEKHTGGAENA